MLNIDIEYTEYPDSIIFKIDHNTYVLTHNQSGNQYPYDLFQVNRGAIEITNINEWIYIQSKGGSLEILMALAKAHDSGMKFSYTLANMEECAQITFKYMRDRLFSDGLASRFADICDVESMGYIALQDALAPPHAEIPNKASRFRHVCEKNGYGDMVSAWDRILSKWDDNPSAITHKAPRTADLDDWLLGEIRKVIKLRFNKHTKYELLLNDCRRQAVSRPK